MFYLRKVSFTLPKIYVKSVRIRSYSGPYFPAFRLNTERYSSHGYITSHGYNTSHGYIMVKFLESAAF